MLIVVAVLSAHIPESFLPPPPGLRLLQFGQVEISAGERLRHCSIFSVSVASLRRPFINYWRSNDVENFFLPNCNIFSQFQVYLQCNHKFVTS